MVEEALNQFPAGVMPSHVFIQGGVGGAGRGRVLTLLGNLGG